MDNEFALVATRILAFSLFFPAFSLIRIPISVRIAFAASFCLLLAPYYSSNSAESSLLNQSLGKVSSGYSLSAMFIEFGIGLFLAVVCGLVFLSVAAFASWICNLICSTWDDTDFDRRQLGMDQLPASVVVAMSLLIGAGILKTIGVDAIIMPLVRSFSVTPFDLATVATSSDSLLSLLFVGGFALQFSLLLAIPFFLVVFLLDLVYLLVYRLCRPVSSPSFSHALRGVVLIVALSLGAIYVEFSSVEHAGRWSRDLLSSAEFK